MSEPCLSCGRLMTEAGAPGCMNGHNPPMKMVKITGQLATAAGYHSRPMTPEWAAELIREERRKDAEEERQAVRDHFWAVVNGQRQCSVCGESSHNHNCQSGENNGQ